MERRRSSFYFSTLAITAICAGTSAHLVNAAEAGGSATGKDALYVGADLQTVRFDHEDLDAIGATALRGRLGYAFNDLEKLGKVDKWISKLAVEAHLAIGADLLDDDPDEIDMVNGQPVIVHAEMEVDTGIGLYLRADRLFLDDKANVYALLGWGKVEIDHEYGSIKETYDESGLGGGFGFQYSVKDNLGVNIDVIGWDADDNYDLYSISAGAVFNF